MATKRTPEERIAYHEAQLAKARRDKRNADARARRERERQMREERARKAEELLSFLEGHTVTRQGCMMTGLAFFEELRSAGAFAPLAEPSGEHADTPDTLHVEGVAGEHDGSAHAVEDSHSDSDTARPGISVTSLTGD